MTSMPDSVPTSCTVVLEGISMRAWPRPRSRICSDRILIVWEGGVSQGALSASAAEQASAVSRKIQQRAIASLPADPACCLLESRDERRKAAVPGYLSQRALYA